MTSARPLPRLGTFDKPFWDFARKHELRVQCCSACGHLRYPPGPACPECLSDDHDWFLLSGRGRVLSWTVFRRQYFPELPIPYVVASIETEEGPLLVGNVVATRVDEVRIGLLVRARFDEVRASEGDWVIPQWEPVGEPAIITKQVEQGD